MNKIYKVIWSKTRNCYMAVAEFVKRNGKGGSVLNRRHIAAALATVAICAAPAGALANTGGHWDGDVYIGDAPYNVTINEEVKGVAYGRYETDADVDASGATLSIVAGGKADAALGGRAVDGVVTGNKVEMTGGEIVGLNPITIGNIINVSGMLIGGFADTGNVEKNTVELAGGTVNAWAVGGFSSKGEAKENSITISGGTVSGMVFGGYSWEGDATTNNTVTISGGTAGHVYGGRSESNSGNATNNTVIISGGTVNYYVYGGNSDSGSATSNTVTISGGTVNYVYGGYSWNGDAVNNTVILSRQGSEAPPVINGTLFGGYGRGTVSDNTLQVEDVGLSAPEIQNFENYRFVLPSDVKKGDTMLTLKGQGADLTIDANKVDMAVAKDGGLNIDFGESITLLHKTGGDGAFSVTNLTGAVQTSKLDGKEDGPEVMKYTLENPTDKLNVTVSELYLYGDGGNENENDPGQRQRGHTLTIKSGKANAAFGGRAIINHVIGNKVKMEGGELVVLADEENPNYSISGNLYGGYAGDIHHPTNAGDNIVKISGGTIGKAVYGGYSKNGNATDNTVEISGGKVGRAVYGGYAENGNATGNTVVISGGMIAGEVSGMEGSVYGGYAENGSATGNTVVLGEGLTDKNFDRLHLYGGNGGDDTSGNTLQVEGRNIKVMSIGRFKNYTVMLPQSVQAGDTILDSARISSGDLILDGSRIRVFSGGRLGLNLGESVTILKAGLKFTETYGEFLLNNADQIPPLTERLDSEATGFVTLAGKVEKKAEENDEQKLNLTVTEKYLYGDGGTNTPGQRQTDNTLTINGGKANAAFGGRATTNDVTGNKVEMSGGELVRLSDSSSPNYSVSGSLYGGYSDSGAVTDNSVDYSGGTVKRHLIGGYSKNGAAGKEGAGNRVVIRGGVAESLAAGGYSVNGDVAGNSLTLSDGRVHSVVYGGRSDLANATGNAVNISGGTAGAIVYGGHSANGNATDNEVTVSDGTIAGMIRGGYSERGMAAGNTVTIEGGTVGGSVYAGRSSDGTVEGNTLNLYGGTVQDAVSGGYSSSSGTVEGNTLTINSGKAMAAFGGRADASDVTGNKVEMSGGELVQLSDSSDPDYGISGNLYGGYTDAGNVQGNTVEMSGGKVESSLYGGYTKSGMAGGDKPEHGNKVSMTGGEANNITGGYTYDGAAGYNMVSVSNAKVAHATGGATLEGDAVGNTVTLTNTELSYKVTGGDVYRGRAAENTVTIDGGSVGMNVFGGVSISGNVENNTVSIRGGKINGVLDGLKTGLTGGYGSERVVGNTVAITGGELFVESVYGGYHTSRSGSGLAEKNVVTLGGGSYDAGLNVIGGGSNNEANDNAVNLTGTTQGLDGAKLYGWKETEDGATVTGTGNELHVGGTKTYDKNGSATIAKGSWQGMDANGKHTNRVDTVANFDSIALHNVVWGDVPALSAKNIENIGGLDVTGLEFFTHPNDSTVHEHALSDSMVLIHSDGKALTGLNISYLDENTVKTEALTNEGINYHTAAHHTEDGGVTVDGMEKKRIYLADHNQSVDFLYHVDGEKITLGDVKFVKDDTARILDGRFDVRNADIDAAGLKMTADSIQNAVAGDTMTVVDAEDAIKAKGATATLKTFTGEGVTGGVKKYDVAFSDDVTANLNLSGIHTDTLSQNAEKTKLIYTVGEKKVSEATMTGELAWQDGVTHYTNKDYNFNADAKTDLSGLTFGKVTADPIGQSMTLIGGKAAGTVENAPASFGVTLAKANTTLDATAAGVATVANGDVTYSVTGVTLDKVTVNQVTASADSVPDTWTVAKDASGKTALTIDTDSMTLSSGSANKEHAILTTSGSFAGAKVTGKYAYASHSPFTKANGGVSIAGEKEGGVKLSDDSKSVVYHVVQDHVKDITLGSVTFAKDTTLLPVGNEYEFTKVNAVNAQNFAMNYAAPQNVAANDSMTLLQANNTLQANALLANMAADVKSQTQPYSFAPVDGVTVAAKITGSLGTTAKGDGFTYTMNSNQADKLTFGSVDWKDGGVLLTRPANITFEGAEVDTSKIHFKNVHGLDANKQMTLVSDFGNNAGKITGSKYYIGATLEGEGSATLNGSDLIFTTKTSTNPNPRPTPDPTPLHAQEQTHNTVMGQTAGVSLLASGAEQISQALNSLSLLDSFGGMTGTGGGTGSTTGTGTSVQTGGEGGSSGQSGSGGSEPSGQGQEGSGGSATGNEKGQGEGSDDRNKNGSGQSDQQESNAEANGIIIASVGGGHMHQETGSHVTSNSWNGVLGIGGKRAAKNGTWQYLAFVEHGRANFTLHSDTGRGDGTSKYVGGGLIGKWQNRRNVYVEASIRAGRMHDTASDMLYDEAMGQSYGYDVHANYIGGHVGLGKVFYYDNGRNLDVYARYFHMKRDGVSFDAGGHFDLDSVTSSVLRVGARYGATDKKWNWYGGLAYEYEFDGKSTGRADGAPIRAASIEGGSVRGEIGLRMEASKSSPWKADINLSGYAGKRRGISGNVAVAYTF